MYKCLKKHSFVDTDGYQLVDIRLQDIEMIRQWRNDQKDILRQNNIIESDEQKAYFDKVIVPTFLQDHPKQILFSLLHHQECIGYGGLVSIDWEAKRAEISFLVNSKRAAVSSQYEKDFNHFFDLLCQVAFKELQFHKLFTETFAYRDAHILLLEKFGFQKEGVLRDHVYKKSTWHNSIFHGLLAQEFLNAK